MRGLELWVTLSRSCSTAPSPPHPFYALRGCNAETSLDPWPGGPRLAGRGPGSDAGELQAGPARGTQGTAPAPSVVRRFDAGSQVPRQGDPDPAVVRRAGAARGGLGGD